MNVAALWEELFYGDLSGAAVACNAPNVIRGILMLEPLPLPRDLDRGAFSIVGVIPRSHNRELGSIEIKGARWTAPSFNELFDLSSVCANPAHCNSRPNRRGAGYCGAHGAPV